MDELLSATKVQPLREILDLAGKDVGRMTGSCMHTSTFDNLGQLGRFGTSSTPGGSPISYFVGRLLPNSVLVKELTLIFAKSIEQEGTT